MAVWLLILSLLGAGAQEPAAASPTDLAVAARKAREAGDLAQAQRLYREALARDPRNGVLALALAETLLDSRDAEGAERILSRLVAAVPDRPGPRRALARALLARGKPAEALEQASRAAKLDPGNLDGTKLLGFALVASDQPEEAVVCFRRVVAARPRDRDGHGGLAMAYAAVADPRAEREFETVLASAPEARYYWQYAEYLWRSHDPERGNRQMEKGLEAAPGDPSLLEAYGVELFEQGRFEQAARRLGQARAAGLASYSLLTHLGSAELENGHFEEAERVLREAVAAGPAQVSARHRLGVLLLLAGKPEAAREELTRAAELSAKSADPWLDLGRAEEAVGNLDASEASYRRVLEIQPDLSRARYLLGALLSRRGKTEQAREQMTLYRTAYEQAQRATQAETSRRSEMDLGWNELRRKRFARALVQFERHPEDAEAQRGAAEALSALGRRRQAIAALERALSLAPGDRGIAWRLGEERRKARR